MTRLRRRWRSRNSVTLVQRSHRFKHTFKSLLRVFETYKLKSLRGSLEDDIKVLSYTVK